MDKEKNLLVVLKGMIVGGTMLVPGISGGSMAMILGIYSRLVSSVSSFMKNKRHNALFLIMFSVGGGLGMFFFAKPLLSLIESYPMPMIYFFIGAVAGGVPLIIKHAKLNRFYWKILVYVAFGVLMVFLISVLPESSNQGSMAVGIKSFIFLMTAGFIAAVALVLPGISISYLLLIIGLYDETMRAISELYLPFLIPLGIGLILGIVLTTRFLEHAMEKYPQATYLVILGFVFGSMAEIFPGVPSGMDIFVCVLMFTVGFVTIWFLSRKEI